MTMIFRLKIFGLFTFFDMKGLYVTRKDLRGILNYVKNVGVKIMSNIMIYISLLD